MIEVRHLVKKFGDSTVIKDINCTIHDGDIIAVIGPSGCGKSTFVRCLNLLDRPTSGEILFDGKNILNDEMKLVDVRKYAGMIFQSFNLYPQYSILENIMRPQVDILKRSKQEAYQRAMENLEMVDLKSAAFKFPNALSGGQKQRVAIARTLAMDNKVLLMDEPTSALDPITVREVQYVLKKLANAGKTMIIVTHDMRLARELANRVFFITDGIVYEEGSPEQLFEHPIKEKTQKFVDCVNESEFSQLIKDFEFASILENISNFSQRNDLTRKKTMSIELLFEELILLHLVPRLKEDTVLNCCLSYSEKTDEIKLTFRYDGDFNPMQKLDELSKKLVEKQMREFHYESNIERSSKLEIIL